MPSKLCLPVIVRLMPINVQRKYSNGEFDKTGPYGHSAMAKYLYGGDHTCPPTCIRS